MASWGRIWWYTPAFASSNLSLPAGSLRSVAPPVFSFTPAVIMINAAPRRSG